MPPADGNGVPSPPATAGAPPNSPYGLSSLIVAGYILAAVLPVFGLVIGVVLVNRSDKREIKHGIWMIGVAVIAGFALFVALILSAHGTGSEFEN